MVEGDIKETVEGVALHTEGVDRNLSLGARRQVIHVALHTEGVDRNNNQPTTVALRQRRPPHGGRG